MIRFNGDPYRGRSRSVPVKKGIKVGVGVWHCCASLELDRQNILLMDYITGLIVLGSDITILLSSTVLILGLSILDERH